jgi:sugar (pentulose or hexulose) kinase
MNYCTLDIGAESGRIVLGRIDAEKLSITEIYRFDSTPVRLPDGLHTDALHIWSELKKGIALAVRAAEGGIAGVGVDTWGVDFALLDRQGRLLANPYHYRDNLTEGILDIAFGVMPRHEIFEQTALQFMPINTLYQLYALQLREFSAFDSAEKLLMMADLFNYWLSGRAANEFTIATTSQCFDSRHGGWAWPVIERFGLPKRLFGDIVMPGTVFGTVLPQVAAETGIGQVPLIAPGCHDTALAVAAVPALHEGFAYISCGTWSLLGAEISSPIINKKSLAGDFTNEGGVCGTFRLQKSITGLWILQECRRQWGSDIKYTILEAEASSAPALQSLIDPADAEFAKPGNMLERIAEFCKKSGQPLPCDKGAIARCVLESLALAYRRTLDELERILGRRLDPVQLVGGGAQNRLLCQCAANAMHRTVIAGPVEATAVGNTCMQAMALGHLGSLRDARALVRKSFETVTYLPKDRERWEDAYVRFRALP